MELLAEVGPNLQLFKVSVDEVREQDVNARVMAPEAFERLTENIKKESRLESLPFTVARGNYFELVSGHHRIRAARAAGLTELFILADTRQLDRSMVVAKQIAHNKISGQDDPQTLAKLYAEMDRVEDVLESFLSPDDFDDVKQLATVPAGDVAAMLEWRTVSLVFLPAVLKRFEALDLIAKKTAKKSDLIGVVDMALFERFRSAVLKVGKIHDVRSLGSVLTRMVEIAEEWIEAHGAERAGETDIRRAGADAAQGTPNRVAGAADPEPLRAGQGRIREGQRRGRTHGPARQGGERVDSDQPVAHRP